jgi:hypothetical protein
VRSTTAEAAAIAEEKEQEQEQAEDKDLLPSQEEEEGNSANRPHPDVQVVSVEHASSASTDAYIINNEIIEEYKVKAGEQEQEQEQRGSSRVQCSNMRRKWHGRAWAEYASQITASQIVGSTVISWDCHCTERWRW